METTIYIDGYNLHYGCLKYSPYKWLDLVELFTRHIIHPQNPASIITKIKFFTADVKVKVASHGAKAQRAQQMYHQALLSRYPEKVEIIKGYYSLEKANLLAYVHPPDKTKRCSVWKLEEKQTDVNIALSAYRDAVVGRAQHMVFVSSDTDLVPVLGAIREDFGDKVQIGVVIPVLLDSSRRPENKQLSVYADWTRHYIRPEELRDSQLPDKIPTRKKSILKPDYW